MIKALPNLEKLDDIPVTAVERTEAQRHGGFLPHPDDEDAYPQSPVSNIVSIIMHTKICTNNIMFSVAHNIGPKKLDC